MRNLSFLLTTSGRAFILGITLLLSCGVAIGSELDIKYQFEPKRTTDYLVQVVSVKNKSALAYLIVDQNRDNFRQPPTNVQVVAARDYADKQPLAPTLTYSYIDEGDSPAPEPVVVAAKNYYKNIPQLTLSDLKDDRVYTYVVGAAETSQGFSQYSKAALDRVDRKIQANRLIGCAPLNLSCERTATENRDTGMDRQKEALDKSKTRQVLKP